MIENTDIKISRLLGLEKKVREARTVDEFQFTLVNHTRDVVDYSYAFLLQQRSSKKFTVQSLSDLPAVDRTAPVVTFMEKVINHKKFLPNNEVLSLNLQDFARDQNLVQPQNMPSVILVLPLYSAQHGKQGLLILCRDQAFTENEIELLRHMSSTYGHAYNSFRSHSFIFSLQNIFWGGKIKWFVLLVITGCLFLPVTMTTTSPIEVIPKDPTIITSPYDAVIKEIVVHNNDTVNKNDLLVLLEDSELINQVNLAERTLNVAETELLRSRQASFTSPKEKSRLAELMAQVELREVELNYAQERLETSRIHALSTGVAIVNDLEDWKGRPVAVGERIITIADPNQIEFLIWLPVKDAVVIENNSLVKMFLDINPLEPLKGKIIRSSFEPELSPEGILAYKLHASLDSEFDSPRIGLQGTSKIYGSRVSLFYYLFRKPLLVLRQLVGV